MLSEERVSLVRSAGNSRGLHADDVDTAHLLGNHDGEGGKGGSADTRNGEELDEPGYVVGLADDAGLNPQLGVNIVEITRRELTMHEGHGT